MTQPYTDDSFEKTSKARIQWEKQCTNYFRGAGLLVCQPTKRAAFMEIDVENFITRRQNDIFNRGKRCVAVERVCRVDFFQKQVSLDSCCPDRFEHIGIFGKHPSHKLFNRRLLMEWETIENTGRWDIIAFGKPPYWSWVQPIIDSVKILSRKKILFFRDLPTLCPPPPLHRDVPHIAWRAKKGWESSEFRKSPILPFMVSLGWLPMWFNPKKVVQTERGLEFLVPCFPRF